MVMMVGCRVQQRNDRAVFRWIVGSWVYCKFRDLPLTECRGADTICFSLGTNSSTIESHSFTCPVSLEIYFSSELKVLVPYALTVET